MAPRINPKLSAQKLSGTIGISKRKIEENNVAVKIREKSRI